MAAALVGDACTRVWCLRFGVAAPRGHEKTLLILRPSRGDNARSLYANVDQRCRKVPANQSLHAPLAYADLICHGERRNCRAGRCIVGVSWRRHEMNRTNHRSLTIDVSSLAEVAASADSACAAQSSAATRRSVEMILSQPGWAACPTQHIHRRIFHLI